MRSGRVAKEGGVGPDRSTESAVCVLAKAQDQERTHGTESAARMEARRAARPRVRLPRSRRNSRTSRRTNPKRCTSRSLSGKSATVPSTAERRPGRRRSGSAFADVPPDQPAKAVEAHNDGSGLARRASRRMPTEQAPGAPQSSPEESAGNLVVSGAGGPCQLVRWRAEYLAACCEAGAREPADKSRSGGDEWWRGEFPGPDPDQAPGAAGPCTASSITFLSPAASRTYDGYRRSATYGLQKTFHNAGAEALKKGAAVREEQNGLPVPLADLKTRITSHRSQAFQSRDDGAVRSVQDARATRHVCARWTC